MVGLDGGAREGRFPEHRKGAGERGWRFVGRVMNRALGRRMEVGCEWEE